MHYLEEQKYLEMHKDELERFIKQQEEALASQVPTNLWAALDQFGKKDDPNKAGQTEQTGQTGPGSEAAAVPMTVTSTPTSQQER